MDGRTIHQMNRLRSRRTLLFFFVVWLCVAATVGVARGQSTPLAAATPSATPGASPAPAPIAAPTPVPLAEVVTQAEAVAADLRDVETRLASDRTVAVVNEGLPALAIELDARLAENALVLDSRPSLDTLRTLETRAQTLGANLPVWGRTLTDRAAQLDAEVARLVRLGETWQATLASATNFAARPAANREDIAPRNGVPVSRSEDAASPSEDVARGEDVAAAAPPETIQRIEAAIANIKRAREEAEGRRAEVLALQSRVAEQNARWQDALAAIRRARDETLDRLLVRDSPPVWSAEVRSRANQNLLEQSRESFTAQLTTLGAYAQRQTLSFALHLGIILLFVAGLYWVRSRVRPWVADEPRLAGVARVFDLPVATALVLSVLVSGWIYPQSPRLLAAILGAAALVPTVIILRRLIEPHLLPVLYLLVVFYFVDQLRTIAASLPLVSRLLFLAEMLAGMLFLVWFVRSRRMAEVPPAKRTLVFKTIRFGARVALVVFLVAFVFSALGYVSLADLLGNALLGSAYLALILYAAVRIADGLIMFSLRVRPLSLLGTVSRHRPRLRRGVHRVLTWLVVGVWALYTLELLSVRRQVVGKVRDALTAELTLGSLSISLGDVLAFGLIVYLAFLLSRALRFVLEEDVYPRAHLARGVPYAISTVLNYVVLVVGFFAAVAALGVDMTKFTILAGAFGVGLGFGMQNIVNNFVSGLILLFERPVKVGDVIQLEGSGGGVVERIGIRASIVRTADSSDIVVPNSKLISDRVTNWTFSDRQRGIKIAVGVEYGSEPRRVIELLCEIARAHPLVADDPPPQALLVEFGADALSFELSAWTNHFGEWAQMRSDLAVSIYERFAAEGIVIPNAQRDIHLRSIDPEAMRAFAGDADGARRIDSHAAPAEEHSAAGAASRSTLSRSETLPAKAVANIEKGGSRLAFDSPRRDEG